MKFEDFLMQRSEEEEKRRELEEEVVKLQEELDGEQKLHRVLQCALHGPVRSTLYNSSLLPLQVQVLLLEVAMVEEEILWLERKVEQLRMSLCQEEKQTKELEMMQQQQQQQQQWRQCQHKQHLICREKKQRKIKDVEQLSEYQEKCRSYKIIRERRAFLNSVSDIHSFSSTRSDEEFAERWKRRGEQSQNQCHLDRKTWIEKPNEISEQLINCVIGIFLKMNTRGSNIVPKLTLSCINSKGLMSKTSFNCKSPPFIFNKDASNLDPYGILPDFDGTSRDIGPYQNFIQITRSSLETSSVSECFPEIGKLRVLMNKLCEVDLTFLTYKQKLAFWINIYNVCIMHAFLQHGLPSTQEKLLALMNKAVLNVGGMVLNALAIEHFILRHPCETTRGPMDEKEMLLRQAYGLGYPEPNVTFALCRGSWSSPALRIYTPDNVVNELGRARVEYLEASVGFANKKRILVPKLLQWHMRDFADDMESLLEWIYSQLPRSGSLKRLIMECLNGATKSPITKMVEIQPYESEFRYLLPM